MNDSNKIRVAVLYGGRSSEHEVSLQSAANVIQHLDQTKFEIVPVGIDKQGNWFLGNDVFTRSLQHKKVAKLDDMHTWFTPEWVGKSVTQVSSDKLTEIYQARYFDVVFPAVHGSSSEDGSLQGLLELARIPYVGSGVLASAICMDKDIAKKLALSEGVNVGPYFTLKQHQWLSQPEQCLQLALDMTYPLFVKPANTGSSVGITKVDSPTQLTKAIEDAFLYDTKILIEKALNVQELEVAVLESLDHSSEPIVSVVGEVKSHHDFYSYQAKYLDENGAELIIPAKVSPKISLQAQTIAKKIFQSLECEGMARVDLFLNKEDDTLYFNEVNTLPGFTQISMYPKLLNASGFAYTDLITHLIELAIRRQGTKSRLVTSYVG